MSVQFIIDEIATVKHLDCIVDALNVGRTFDIRLLMFFQSAGQYGLCFPEGQEQTMLSNTTQIFFGVNDQQTAEMVSKRLGERTIVVDSGGSSRGSNRGVSFGRDRSSNQGSNSGTNSSWQQQKRNVLNSDEVIGLSQRTAITLTPSLPPIRTTLIRYYEEKHLGRRSLFRRSWAACSMLVKSAVLCALMVGLAMALTNLVNQPHRAPVRYQPTNVFGQ